MKGHWHRGIGYPCTAMTFGRIATRLAHGAGQTSTPIVQEDIFITGSAIFALSASAIDTS